MTKGNRFAAMPDVIICDNDKEAMTDTSRVIRSAARKLAAWKDQEQVGGEQRRQRRQTVHIAAKINVGGSLRDCLVLDISISGARVAVEAPKDIPDRIAICMTTRGFPIHGCRVIWRSDCEIGVEFEVAAQVHASTSSPWKPAERV